MDFWYILTHFLVFKNITIPHILFSIYLIFCVWCGCSMMGWIHDPIRSYLDKLKEDMKNNDIV